MEKKILAPAKINLFLQVTGRRPNGYHDLFSLMCPIALWDKISLRFETERTRVFCHHPQVPEDETNLVHRAADLFFSELNKAGGVEISIEKHIPVAAGLGGGSSDAAAVLLELNRFYGLPFTRDQLMRMGLSIGADVPFFIYGKPAFARGIGEKLEPCTGLPSYKILLVCQSFGVSTSEAYKNLNLRLTKCENKLNKANLKQNGFGAEHLCNDLETYTISAHPEIDTAKKALGDHGAIGALMSGSGPTVFGFFDNSAKAMNARRELSQNYGWEIRLTELLSYKINK